MKVQYSRLYEDNILNELPIIHSYSKTHNHKPHVNKYRKPIIVNLGDTQYPVVEQICDELGWRIQQTDTRNWDIKWTDSAVSSQYFNKMSQHQKINHFPGMSILSRKNNLTKCVQRMQQKYLQEYNFYPRTFLLPFDKHKLKSYNEECRKQGIQKTFIVKPEAGSQGKGIFITQNINQIQQFSHCVVQKYLVNPLLYKGLKFDLRVYALVAGCDPLRIYIYNQGLTRFATEKYKLPCQNNFDNLYMHLTNYAINKDHPNYVYNDSAQNLSYGHKKSLAQFFQTLKNLGLKAHQYWSDIKDIIVKTMISGQPHLQHEYRMSQPHNLKNDMCFEVLGFDFMIDANNKCYVLEINHTPSFTTDTPLDDLIKSNLIRDSLTLMNINSKTRDKMLSELKQQGQRRVFTGKSKKYTPEERQKKILELQLQRDLYQKDHLGSFQKIYPCRNSIKQKKYQQFLQSSMFCYKQTNGGGTKARNSPSKFRVKMLSTSHATFQSEFKNDESPNNSKYILKRTQNSFFNRQISTAAKLNNMAKGQSLEKKNNNILNPQKYLKLKNVQESQQRLNPMMTGTIIANGENNFSSDLNGNKTLNQMRRAQYLKILSQSFKNSKINIKIQKCDTRKSLKTRQQQSTMFSRHSQKQKCEN